MGVKEEFIPLSVPTINGNEWQYVKECLDTGWVSSAGKYVDKFEADICEYTGAKHAVACVNGTAALQVALRLVGVSAGDEVIVPTLTFIAPVNAARYLGAEPIFMDCDNYLNIDIPKTVQFINEETEFNDGYSINKKTGKIIRAIVPVHMYGNAVDLSPLLGICQQKNIKVVEDASESLGTVYTSGNLKGKHTGTIGDIGCYSFNGNKIMTTGGGGMIVTDSPEYATKAKYLTTQAKDDEVRYIHNEIGYNYRLTNIQAALGVAQLERLPEYIKLKKNNYDLYKKEIDKISGLHLAEGPAYARCNHWMYLLIIDKDKYGLDREGLMKKLADYGIQSRPIWYLNHLQKPYLEYQHYKIEKAHGMLERTLNIPCSANLTSEDVFRTIGVLREGGKS